MRYDEVDRIVSEHLKTDIDRWYLANLHYDPHHATYYDAEVLGGVTKTICIGGRLHRTSQWDRTICSEQMIFTITLHTNIIQYNRDDIITSFCDRRDNDEWNGCPYVKHYWGDYYTPDEWDCPGEFCPADSNCPYNQTFIEDIVEGLQDLGIDTTLEDWYV